MIQQARKLPVVGRKIPLPEYAISKKKSKREMLTEGENIMLALEGVAKPPSASRGRNKQMLSILDSIKKRQAQQLA